MGTEVALEALADTAGVIAETTAGAITTEVVALAEKDVGARGAFFEGAVRTTGTKVANAAYLLGSIPRLGVGFGGFVGEVFLGDAATTAVAVAGTGGTLAGLAIVSIEALAFSSLSVARAFAGAFLFYVGCVVAGGQVNEGSALRASTIRAVGISPGRVVILRA